MKKGNIAKGIILGLSLLGSAFFVDSYVPHTPTYAHELNINMLKKSQNEVNITDVNLRKAICKLLDKDISSKLYADDFMKSENYVPDKITGKAKRMCLDLSYSGITNIIELVQFEFPSTLVAIDLSGNNLNSSHIGSILSFLNYNTTQGTVIVDETSQTTLNIKSDFDTLIKKVNLNFNEIDLDSINQSILDNQKLIFGIQKLHLSSNHLYLYDEVKDAKYYIRDNDIHYLNFTFTSTHKPYQIIENAVTALIPANEYGEYEFNVANPPSTATGYFYGVNIHENLKVFNAEIKSTFTVERKSLFNLTSDDIQIDGILGEYNLAISNASTNTIGYHDVNIRITADNATRSITLKFLVVDTVKPTINLEPNNTNIIYWRQGKTFEDPGYIGLDSGDDLTNHVNVDYSNLDITKLGTYTITYTLSDLSGNSDNTVTVARTVVVQEQVLDEINIKINTEEISVGKEIVLTVQPHENIDTSKYKDFNYTWYMDGVAFKTSTGDISSGKSSIIINPTNTKTMNIYVELHAKQKLDNADIFVESQSISLTPKLSDSNTTLIIAMVVAIGIVLVITIGSGIVKHRKARKLTNKKSSKSNNSSTQKDSGIQVIKNYKDDSQNK